MGQTSGLQFLSLDISLHINCDEKPSPRDDKNSERVIIGVNYGGSGFSIIVTCIENMTSKNSEIGTINAGLEEYSKFLR